MAGVSVDPNELRWHASRLLAMADALAGQTVVFGDRASLSSTAAPPGGRQAEWADSDRLQAARESLDQLQSTLRQLAENLVAAADSWDLADRSSV